MPLDPNRKSKVCPSCKIDKPISEWYLHKHSRNGLGPHCKACTIIRVKAYAEKVKKSPRVVIPGSKKTCPRCQKPKPISEYHLNRRRPDKCDVYCKQCKKEIHPNKYLKHTYGITISEFNQMLTEQNGVCAICKGKETTIHLGKKLRLSVDHDHQTKKVRGLLCYSCNHLVGYADRFGVKRLLAAIKYLQGT